MSITTSKHQFLHRRSFDERGFTLLEILIALFIFTIISTILVGALRRVIDADIATDTRAAQLRELQMALLIISRDTEQTVDRPIINTQGRQETAFIGSSKAYTFTHMGYANPNGAATHSVLQRTRYAWSDNAIWRSTWAVLDQAPQSRAHARRLMPEVTTARFQYLDKEGHFHDNWPLEGNTTEVLPRAVRVSLTISHWGTVSQLYVISAQANIPTPSTPPAQNSAQSTLPAQRT